MQSEALTRFYQAYLAWVEAGAHEENEHMFSRGVGLCTNLHIFSKYNDTLLTEMVNQFKEAGLDRFYPFNKYSSHYGAEKTHKRCHSNNNRMAWVREHAQARSWPCWSCKQPVTMRQRADADGNCPHCNAELDIELWPFPESAA